MRLDRRDDLRGLRLRTRPQPGHRLTGLSEITNFSKFHWTSPASPSASASFVSSAYSGCRSPPLTSVFSSSGKLTPYVVEQKVWISSALPGSCPANWLHGTPSTVRPRSP